MEHRARVAPALFMLMERLHANEKITRRLFRRPFRHFAGGLCDRILPLFGSAEAASYNTTYQGPRSPIAVGKFDNRSSYMNGIFSDGVDRLGNQSKTILITHLQQTGRFNVLDRANMEELKTEAGIKGKAQTLKGANYVITGDVTEFGRKEVGDHQPRAFWAVVNHRSLTPKSI